MDEKTYLKLLDMVTPMIVKKDTVMRSSISPHERLSVTLRFLATGRSYEDLKFSAIISPQALGKIIPETCEALYKVLRRKYLKFPACEEEWKEIAKLYEERWNFPHCLGAIDGKHIAIVPPANSGSYYYNYKGHHSLVLMAIVNAKYQFLYVDVGMNGRISDGGVLQNTFFFEKLENRELRIPSSETLTGSNRNLPYVFVADDAFPLRPDMIKPFRQADLTSPERKTLNYRLSRARRTVENAFGIMASRFRIFYTHINLEPENIGKVVKGSCALHNFLIEHSKKSYAPLKCFYRENPENGVIISEGYNTENSTMENLERRNPGELTKEELENLGHWATDLQEENEKNLTVEGEEEMILLAERMQKRFPNIIKNNYNNETFTFRYTATQRAQQSARHFTIGLFNKKNAQNVQFHPANKVDPVLRFYKLCDKWQKQVKKNKTTYEEQILYSESEEINASLATISKRLGFDRVLTFGEANLMYKACGFETAWHKDRISPWCYGLSKEDAERFEYYGDLKTYWLDGYGSELTHRQACLSVKTMFEIFTKDKAPNATFLFAHSGTILKILSHLQLYKPREHLRGNQLCRDREWRSSDIDCFASNLAFVLFKCEDGDYVLTLHQERITKLPMCDQELCPLRQLTEYFHDSINNCDFNDICTLEKRSEL